MNGSRMPQAVSSGYSASVGEAPAAAAGHAFTRLRILGCDVDYMNARQLHDWLEAERRSGRRRIRVNGINPHFVLVAREQPALRTFSNACEVNMADGFGVGIASWLQGYPGRNLRMPTALEVHLEEPRPLSLFMLGASDEDVRTAAANTAKRWPHVRIAGVQHGFFAEADEPAIVDRIAAARPDVLFVSLPTPKREVFVERHYSRLDAGEIWFSGGYVEVLAGRRHLAPQWISTCGLEWFYRFVQEPRRLWRRGFVELPVFCWLAVKERLTA